METLPIHFGLLLILGHFGSACILQKDTDQPWLIRIALHKKQPPVTFAHGSLISPDKVLTAATIDIELLKAGVNLANLGEDVLMTAYNSKADCNQTLFAYRVDFHWKYDVHKYQYCRLGEFALLRARESFVTEGAPFLFPPGSYSTMADNIETLLNGFNTDNSAEPQVSVYVYLDKAVGGAVVAGHMTYLSWAKCTETEGFKGIVGKRDPNVTSTSFFCTDKMPVGNSGAMKNDKGFGYNWFQGAPVVFHNRSSTPSNGTPSEGEMHNTVVGQFMFWTGETGSPFVFATYTKYLTDFLEDRIPISTTNNGTTEPEPTWPTARPTIFTRSLEETTKSPPMSPRIVPPTSGVGNRYCQPPIWILVISLLSFIVSSHQFILRG